MTMDIMVPDLPESVSDATVGTWHKNIGEPIKAGELLVDLETDKVVLEVPAPQDGILSEQCCATGDIVQAKALLAKLNPLPAEGKISPAEMATAPVATPPTPTVDVSPVLSPSVRRMVAEENLDPAAIEGSGKNGRITKQDVAKHVATPAAKSAAPQPVSPSLERNEVRVPMTRIRQRIAERLLEAKNATAMLTTFNEVNMKPIMQMRKSYQDEFEKRHGIKLGFMSFFVKAVCEALKKFPTVNAFIDGNDILYHNYFDVSIAVSTDRGLVTPILRDCDSLSLADIEKGIKYLADKARDGKLSVDDLTGGNFTITNGGVFGSLMSTPIINPPQSAILGMHKIQDRPVAVEGRVEILPMMYLALSYDHRIIDGRESVGFLVEVKKLLEDPTRILLDI